MLVVRGERVKGMMMDDEQRKLPVAGMRVRFLRQRE